MTIGTAFYKLLISPLELLFEFIFSVAYRIVGSPGLSIVFLSLAMNLLVLPLYRRADALQAEERDRDARLRPWITHIRKTFSGDERFMMLQTYYRENHYSPLSALNGSFSLLLEIPFFIAAYHFLSHLQLLHGVSLGPIRDLGLPDALLTVSGHKINVLPLLMTGINLISAYLYLEGFPLKNKLQMYGMAFIFLVFLYRSPAGLVFYWTLNNVFSLWKNIVYRLKKSHKTVHKSGGDSRLPHSTGLFLFSCIFLTLLTGVLIPSAIIQDSPLEFIQIQDYRSPLLYVLSSFLTACGTFLLWLGVFYHLASPQGKKRMTAVMWASSVLAAVNYMFFGKNYGTILPSLIFESPPVFPHRALVLNLAVLLFAAVVVLFALRKNLTFSRIASVAMCLAVLGMSAVNLFSAGSQLRSESSRVFAQASDEMQVKLSLTGKNVIVLMLDRAISPFIPYLLQEDAALQQQFEGFTFYPNTLSYGRGTNTGSPALFGGYEYTPESINLRSDELLVDKHNEALQVMPVLFLNHGYGVTVCDPAYAGYSLIPDTGIYDEYPEIHAYITEGAFTGRYLQSIQNSPKMTDVLNRNFFCYSIFKIAPVFCQKMLYCDGTYHRVDFWAETNTSVLSTPFYQKSISVSHGVSDEFLDSYSVLKMLPELTVADDSETGQLLMMANNTTHSPILLQEPDYEPANNVDNTAYDEEHLVRTSIINTQSHFYNETVACHYETNMAALRALGAWFDVMRQNSVYDNTRIIIVSDHGRGMKHGYEFGDPNAVDEDGLGMFRFWADTYGENIFPDMTWFNALLLVKDFDSQEFRIDWSFMTNADVPVLATEDLISSPVNPMTGVSLDASVKENSETQLVFFTDKWKTSENNGTTFLPGAWYRVGKDIFSPDSWTLERDDAGVAYYGS